MSRHILENEFLQIAVDDAGAELSRVYDKVLGCERLWNADPAIWNRHAPILFPFVGKLTDGKYRVGGKEYPMKTQHGFARDSVFACVEETENAVTHCLVSSEATKALYPCDFRLFVRHSLSAAEPRTLLVQWTVENAGGEEMLFSIGGHPAFLPPAGAAKEDCFLLFPGKDELCYIQASPAGYALVNERHRLPLNEGRAAYQADIPGTWIFEDGQIRKVCLAGPDGKPYVSMDCAQFPMLAVWANPKGPFVCLEPWFGRTDDEGFAGEIGEKKGIQRLAAGEKREISYAVTFHTPAE